MSFISFDKDFWRRFRLYAVGLLFGLILVNVITKGKACQIRTPGSLKIEELNFQVPRYSTQILCQIEKLNLTTDDLKTVLKGGTVHFSKSQIHHVLFPTYVISGQTSNSLALELDVMDKADTTFFVKINQLDASKDCHEAK